jgi:hypothetical protein
MSQQLQRLETRPERLWREFIEARDRAMDAGPRDLDLGIQAGRAWSAFMAEFVPDRDLREAVHGKPSEQR